MRKWNTCQCHRHFSLNENGYTVYLHETMLLWYTTSLWNLVYLCCIIMLILGVPVIFKLLYWKCGDTIYEVHMHNENKSKGIGLWFFKINKAVIIFNMTKDFLTKTTRSIFLYLLCNNHNHSDHILFFPSFIRNRTFINDYSSHMKH